MNQELQALHEQLLSRHQTLYERLDNISDPIMAQTFLTEMREILHRISLVQGLLLSRTSAELQASVEKVDAADARLTKALQEAQTAADVVNGIGKFLTVVDKAIDLAKTLGAALV
jgi:hypothetical protein